MHRLVMHIAQDEGAPAPSGMARWMRSELPDWLRESSFLLENWQWLALLATAILGVLVDRACGLSLRGGLVAMLRRRGASVADHTIDAGIRPFRVLAMGATWWVLLPLLALPASAGHVLLLIAKFVVIGSGVFGAYRLVDVATAALKSRAAGNESKLDDLLVPLFGKSVKVFVAAFGSVFLASNFDVNVGSLLAGLGLGGLAFALAAQTTVKNLFGSVTVVVDRPFQIGDPVVIGGIEGTVESLGFRSTRIRTPQDSLVTIANSELLDTRIENLGARRHRRFRNTLLLEPTTTAAQLDAFCVGINELVRLHPEAMATGLVVGFQAFTKDGIELLLSVNFGVTTLADEARARHLLGSWILRLAGELGIEFASPMLRRESARPARDGVPPDPIEAARRIAGWN